MLVSTVDVSDARAPSRSGALGAPHRDRNKFSTRGIAAAPAYGDGMKARASWTVSDHHGLGMMGGAHVDSVEAAARAVEASVRRMSEQRILSRRAHEMRKAMRSLRRQMLSEGRISVDAGRTWRGSANGITVTIRPPRRTHIHG